MINRKRVSFIGLLALLTTSSFGADLRGDNINVNAGDLFVIGDTPSIFIDDKDEQAQQYEWMFTGYSEYFAIYNSTNANLRNTAWIQPSENNKNSLKVDDLGNVSFAENSVFIDKANNRMGVGTSTPTKSLHITGAADILLDEDNSKWGLFNWGSGKVGFTIGDKSTTQHPIIVEKNTTTDTLYLSENGSIGIGTDTPSVKLNVQGDTSVNGELNTTKAINATFSGSRDASVYQMLALSANNTNTIKKSDSGFSIENAREDFKWTFRTWEPDSGFAISKVNSGDKEFRLTGSSTADNVELHLSSGAYCDSNGQWHNASSRSYKENISALSGKEAMNTLNSLQSVKYNFKRDKNKETLVGFIAEDMPTLLATKDKKTVDSLQIVSLLIKVKQEQQKSINDKNRRVNILEEEISKMETILADILKRKRMNLN